MGKSAYRYSADLSCFEKISAPYKHWCIKSEKYLPKGVQKALSGKRDSRNGKHQYSHWYKDSYFTFIEPEYIQDYLPNYEGELFEKRIKK